jgi:hypothetical protein
MHWRCTVTWTSNFTSMFVSRNFFSVGSIYLNLRQPSGPISYSFIFDAVLMCELLPELNLYNSGPLISIYNFFLRYARPETCLSVRSSPLTHDFIGKSYTSVLRNFFHIQRILILLKINEISVTCGTCGAEERSILLRYSPKLQYRTNWGPHSFITAHFEAQIQNHLPDNNMSLTNEL